MSLEDFILPDIGEGIVECELVEWRIKEGDFIQEDQSVADVSTDKAVVEITAMHTGRVDKLYYQQGEIAKVHTPLFAIEVETAEVSTSSTDTDKTIADNETIIDFILPDIGEGIVECEVVEWLVAEGEEIEEDQRIADVSTDKALVEIPSMHTGRVVKLYYAQGEIAKVHSPMFAIAVKAIASNRGVELSSLPKNIECAGAQSNKALAVEQQQVLATPAVRRIARENNLNLSLVPSSGKNGRVLKEDALNYLQQIAVGQSSTQAIRPSLVSQSVVVKDTAANTQISASSTSAIASRFPQDIIGASKDIVSATQDSIEPIKGIRAIMAKTMMESVTTIPHFTYADEVDMSNLIALRTELKEVYAKQGVRLTMMPFFIKALSLAIKRYPILNSQVNEDCTQLHYLASHNIGMAVDSPMGLLVPNIKNVQDLSIIDIAEHSNRLTELARAGRLSPSDLKDGTITISNVGAIGGTVATPIITKPEVAIVALGKVQSLPRFDESASVVAQKIMTISWSGDHRVIDGATMARFSNCWKAFLENPSSMLMAMS